MSAFSLTNRIGLILATLPQSCVWRINTRLGSQPLLTRVTLGATVGAPHSLSTVSSPSSPNSSPVALVRRFYSYDDRVADCVQASNPTLPFSAYPPLTISGDNRSGGTPQLNYTDSTTTQKFLQIYYGLDNYAVPINEDMTVSIPSHIQGTAYA